MALRFGRNSGATISAASFVRGPQGAAATLDVGTTSALAAGATPTVTNSGDTSDAIFDFGIPRGADSGIKWLFDSSTTMADPGTGDFRLNHATLASVTAISVSATGSGSDVSDYVATWDDSTNTTKGYVVLREEAGGTVAVFSISAVTDNTAWLQLTVAYVSGSLSLTAADPVYFIPLVTGNKGLDGEIAGPGVSVDSEIALFNGTSGATLKRASTTGILKATSGVISAAVASTDYAPATSGSAILKGNGTGGFSSAAAGTDYQSPIGTISGIAKGNGANALTAAVAGTDYQSPIGTISGVAKGNGANALTAATAGTDFVKPDTTTAFTAHQGVTLATLTDGATISWTVSTGQKAKVTLGGNRTMNAVTGAVEGYSYFIWVIQDGTGSRTISWTTTGAGSFDFGTDGAPTLTTTASKADLLCFEAISIGGTLKLRYAGSKKGFT